MEVSLRGPEIGDDETGQRAKPSRGFLGLTMAAARLPVAIPLRLGRVMCRRAVILSTGACGVAALLTARQPQFQAQAGQVLGHGKALVARLHASAGSP